MWGHRHNHPPTSPYWVPHQDISPGLQFCVFLTLFSPDSAIPEQVPPLAPRATGSLGDTRCPGGFVTHGCHVLEPTAAQSWGSIPHGRRNSCPCSWIHLFATGRDKDTPSTPVPLSAPARYRWRFSPLVVIFSGFTPG